MRTSTKFTCKLQLAKHDLDEVIEFGSVDFQSFLNELNKVDWEFEADRLQFLNKTSPAIGITNHDNNAVLWLSPYRPLPPDFLDEDEFRHNMAIWFLVKLDNPPNPPEITDFESSRLLEECYFESYDMAGIEDLFGLFLADDYQSLYESLYSMQVARFVDT